MSPALSYAVAAYLGVVALVALLAIKVPSLDPTARTAMRVGQLGAAIVVGLDLLKLAQGHEVASPVTHLGYAVAILGLPAILLTSRAEEPQVDEESAGDPEGVHDQRPEGVDGSETEPGPTPNPVHLGVLAVTATAMVVLVIRLQMTL